MGFWIAAIAAALATALWVARPLALARTTARPRAAFDEQVFRDQLGEIDRDLERGVLSEDEARGARIEISRRLLAAAAEREQAPDHQPAPKALSLALTGLLLIGAPLGAWGIYAGLGAPGLPDQPLSTRAQARPAQEVAEAQIDAPMPEAPPGSEELWEMVVQLEERVAGPDAERQGVFLLARSYGQLGRWGDSWRAYRRLIDMSGGDAPATIHTAMAEAMVLATQGYVSPDAEAALEEALRREPGNPVARYYMGAAYAQTGRPQSAMEIWAGLVTDSPAEAPWLPGVRAQMAELSETTGLALPDVSPQPPADPAQAQAEMAEMVQALDDRLAQRGGGPGQWAQLVRSWAALEQPEKAAAAEARARAALMEAGDLAAFEAALTRDAAPRGPTQDEVAAAQDMAPQDRMAMIRGMVEGLQARLNERGGDVEEWAQLIRSLGALGRTDEAAEAYATAVAAHRSDGIGLALLREQALLAGAPIE